MSPSVYHQSAGIGIDGAEQSLEGVVEADDDRGCAQRLQVLGNKTHPGLFAGADENDGAEKQRQIALQAQETADMSDSAHAK